MLLIVDRLIELVLQQRDLYLVCLSRGLWLSTTTTLDFDFKFKWWSLWLIILFWILWKILHNLFTGDWDFSLIRFKRPISITYLDHSVLNALVCLASMTLQSHIIILENRKRLDFWQLGFLRTFLVFNLFFNFLVILVFTVILRNLIYFFYDKATI
jgi:hypothetical protein